MRRSLEHVVALALTLALTWAAPALALGAFLVVSIRNALTDAAQHIGFNQIRNGGAR